MERCWLCSIWNTIQLHVRKILGIGMREILITLPLLIPLLTAMILVLLWNKPRWQRLVTVLGASLYLAAVFALLFRVQRDGIHSVQLGNWPPPFGITFVADLFSAIMLAVTGIIVFAVAIYSLGNIDERRAAYGYYPLILRAGYGHFWLISDRRYVQPVCLVRSDVDCLLCVDSPWWGAYPNGGRPQICGPKPAFLSHLPGGGRNALWCSWHPQYG